MSLDKEHPSEGKKKKGSFQRNRTQQVNSSDSILSPCRNGLTGLPINCAPSLSSLSGACLLSAPSKKLGTVVAGKRGGVSCSALYLILYSEISGMLISQDRTRQALCKQVFPGPFPPRTRFFFHLLLQL